MAKSNDHQKATDDSFGAHLARLRNAAGLTLRQVEVATNEEVSNAYLSQLENNKIVKPSPNVLHALKAAREIGLKIPVAVLDLADELIQ